MKRGWKRRIGDTVKARLDFLAFAVLRRLPIDLASAIGGHAARVRGPTHYRAASERAANNLRRLQPGLSDEDVRATGLARWENVGRLMTEYAILDRLMPEARVRIEGAEHLRAVQQGGTGFILLGVHLANWEVWGPVLSSLGAAPTSFYETPPSASRDALARKMRRRLGVTLLPLGMAGLRPALEALRAGKAVAVFADEVRANVVQGPFLDRPAHTRGNLGLAARLARQAGVPILPGYVLREEGAWFRAVILPSVSLPPEPRPGARLIEDVKTLNATVEPAVRAHLDQWYYLHFKL